MIDSPEKADGSLTETGDHVEDVMQRAIDEQLLRPEIAEYVAVRTNLVHGFWSFLARFNVIGGLARCGPHLVASYTRELLDAQQRGADLQRVVELVEARILTHLFRRLSY